MVVYFSILKGEKDKELVGKQFEIERLRAEKNILIEKNSELTASIEKHTSSNSNNPNLQQQLDSLAKKYKSLESIDNESNIFSSSSSSLSLSLSPSLLLS
jgi:hypothetical protein